VVSFTLQLLLSGEDILLPICQGAKLNSSTASPDAAAKRNISPTARNQPWSSSQPADHFTEFYINHPEVLNYTNTKVVSV
jgi:hypothetical protein